MSKVCICSTILLALLVMLPPAYAVEPSAEFRCKDPFVRDGSRASLIKTFGAANLAREDIFFAGDTVPMTVIFPKNPRRRLEIMWRDMKNERGIATIIIESMWSVGGIAIGASIVDVEKVNGRPFKISDGEGDLGFMVSDWQGGRLATLPGGCGIAPEFSVEETAFHLFDKEISDGTLLSNGAGLRAAKPIVGAIFVNFAN